MPRQDDSENEQPIDKEEVGIQVVTSEQLINLKLDRILEGIASLLAK
jgi:hypothetical protein